MGVIKIKDCKARPGTTDQSLNVYRCKTIILFVLSFALGFLTVLAQHADILPFFPWLQSSGAMDWRLYIGPCLTRSCVVPLLFFLGIHRPSYPYLSALLLSVFFYLQGLEACSFWLDPSLKSGVWETLVLGVLLLLMIRALVRARVAAARPFGFFVCAWLAQLVLSWGGLLTLEFLIYMLIKK